MVILSIITAKTTIPLYEHRNVTIIIYNTTRMTAVYIDIDGTKPFRVKLHSPKLIVHILQLSESIIPFSYLQSITNLFFIPIMSLWNVEPAVYIWITVIHDISVYLLPVLYHRMLHATEKKQQFSQKESDQHFKCQFQLCEQGIMSTIDVSTPNVSKPSTAAVRK